MGVGRTNAWVTGSGGDIQLDLVSGATLPRVVTNGRIFVVTPDAVSQWSVSTNTPVNPVVGDVWIKVAQSDNGIEVLSPSPRYFTGLARAMQYSGSMWVALEAYMGVGAEWVQFSARGILEGDLPPPPDILYGGKWTGWSINRYESYIDYSVSPSALVALPNPMYWECMITTSGILYVAANKSYAADAWGIGGGGTGSNVGGYSGATGMVLASTLGSLTGNVAVSIGAPGVNNTAGNTMLRTTTISSTGTHASGGSSAGNVNGNHQGRIISRFYDPSKNTEYGRCGSHVDYSEGHSRTGGGGFFDFGYAGINTPLNMAGGGFGAGTGSRGYATYGGISGCLLLRIPMQ